MIILNYHHFILDSVINLFTNFNTENFKRLKIINIVWFGLIPRLFSQL